MRACEKPVWISMLKVNYKRSKKHQPLLHVQSLRITMKSFVSLLISVHLIQASVALYRSLQFGGSNTGNNFDDRAYSLTSKKIGFSKILIRSGAYKHHQGHTSHLQARRW